MTLDYQDATDTRVPLRVLVPARRRDIDPDSPTVSIVVPTLNEARNLPWLAQHMPSGFHELIIVDGRSTDPTREVARRLWPAAKIIEQTRRGKGNALACGFAAATGEIIVMIDADGSMDPGEIPFFVDALVQGADYAKGSRFTAGGGSSDITRVRAVGNKFLNKVTNVGHGTRYSDLCYGYNAFWRHVVPHLKLNAGVHGQTAAGERLWGDGFEIETLINIRVHNAGMSIVEVPSFESERIHGVSNLNAVSDGIRVLRTIATERRIKLTLAVSPALTQPHEGSPLLLVEGESGTGQRGTIPEVGDVEGYTSQPDRVVDLAAYERLVAARREAREAEDIANTG